MVEAEERSERLAMVRLKRSRPSRKVDSDAEFHARDEVYN